MPRQDGCDFEPAELIEQAAKFEREGDLQGALARAQLAVKCARGDMRDDAVLALDRIAASEHAWRSRTEKREAEHEELERSSLALTEEQERALAIATAPSAVQRFARWVRERIAPHRAVAAQSTRAS